MRMIVRAAAVAAALTLGGCFGTEEDVFPTTGGVETALEVGEYECSDGGQRVDNRTISSFRVGDKTMYVSIERGIASLHSMHLLTADIYANVEASASKGQRVVLMREVGGDEFEVLRPTLEQAQKTAGLTGAVVKEDKFDTMLLEGSAGNQKKFFLALARRASDFRVSIRCKRETT